MSEAYKKRSVMQANEDPPAIKNRNKPAMGATKPRRRRIAAKLAYMPTGEPPTPAADETGLMPLVPEDAASYTPPWPPPELAPRVVKTADQQSERYVRMRMRVHDDQIEIVGAWVVEGPLARPETLHAGLVYEAAVGKKQLNIGSITNEGVRRSFPPHEPDDERKGHHITEVPTYEFPVRISQQELTERDLPKLRVSVYRIKSQISETRAIGYAPLREQFAAELRPVAELKGIRLNDLPDNLQEQMKKALQR